MEINFEGRSVDIIFIQTEIIGHLTIGGARYATVRDLKKLIRMNKSFKNLDDLAFHMEFTKALTKLQKEDGTVAIIGEAYSDTSTVMFNPNCLKEFATMQ